MAIFQDLVAQLERSRADYERWDRLTRLHQIPGRLHAAEIAAIDALLADPLVHPHTAAEIKRREAEAVKTKAEREADPVKLLAHVFLEARVETGFDRNSSIAEDRYVSYTSGLGWNSGDLATYASDLALEMAHDGLAALAAAGWRTEGSKELSADNFGDLTRLACLLTDVALTPSDTPGVEWFWSEDEPGPISLASNSSHLDMPGFAPLLAQKMAEAATRDLETRGFGLQR